jgi:hypothetical protein
MASNPAFKMTLRRRHFVSDAGRRLPFNFNPANVIH